MESGLVLLWWYQSVNQWMNCVNISTYYQYWIGLVFQLWSDSLDSDSASEIHRVNHALISRMTVFFWINTKNNIMFRYMNCAGYRKWNSDPKPQLHIRRAWQFVIIHPAISPDRFTQHATGSSVRSPRNVLALVRGLLSVKRRGADVQHKHAAVAVWFSGRHCGGFPVHAKRRWHHWELSQPFKHAPKGWDSPSVISG